MEHFDRRPVISPRQFNSSQSALLLQALSQILRAVKITGYGVVSVREGDYSLVEQALGFVAIRAT